MRMPRLRTVSPKDPGWTRRRAGKGFVYLDQTGARLAPEDAERCKLLVIPPAWEQVWICPVPNGHMQAVGTDDAGRRQYLYHQQWRIKRDKSKHDRVLTVAARLPDARKAVVEGPAAGRDAVRAGPGHGVPAAGPGLLPDRRRGVRGGQQQLRAGHHPQGARDDRGVDGGLRLRGQVGAGALRRAGRRPGPAGRTRPAAAGAAVGRSCWRTEDGEDLARRQLGRHQRLHQGAGGRRGVGQGLPHLARHGDRRGRRWPRRTRRPGRPRRASGRWRGR